MYVHGRFKSMQVQVQLSAPCSELLSTTGLPAESTVKGEPVYSLIYLPPRPGGIVREA